MTTARYGFSVQGEAGQTLETPAVKALLDLNYLYTKKAIFPAWSGVPQVSTYTDTMLDSVPTPVFLWEAFVPTEFILSVPRSSKQIMADEFEEANPGVQFPYFWSGNGVLHSRATGLPA